MNINNQPLLLAEDPESNYLCDWRAHQYSLTDKLKAAKGGFDLELLSQGWIKPTWWDKSLLQINDEQVFQREILMKHQGAEYWYARTIIPQKCYFLNPEYFDRLEHESIRNLIFDSPIVHRVQLVNYSVNNQCIEFHWVKKYINPGSQVLWVRFSEFTLQYLEPFYLMEVLLPDLEKVL